MALDMYLTIMNFERASVAAVRSLGSGYFSWLLHTHTIIGVSEARRLSPVTERKKERNVSFNDALNTFYIPLYGVRHMVKDHSDSKRGTRCCHIGYSFRLAARVLLYAPSHRQDNTYHGFCYTSRGALAQTQEILDYTKSSTMATI